MCVLTVELIYIPAKFLPWLGYCNIFFSFFLGGGEQVYREGRGEIQCMERKGEEPLNNNNNDDEEREIKKENERKGGREVKGDQRRREREER